MIYLQFYFIWIFFRYCKALAEENRVKEYGYSISISFHSDELVTHRGFYIEFRAFSHIDRKCYLPLINKSLQLCEII